jgi:DNA replication ATP-dependent helicase Dna2
MPLPPPNILETPAPGHQVLAAIRAELAAQPKSYVFRVISNQSRDGYLILGLKRLNNGAPPLDESFEGCQLWWPGSHENPGNGSAGILLVNLDSDEVVLAGTAGAGPASGSNVVIYPPRFLESLETAWEDTQWVSRINASVVASLRATIPTGQSLELRRYPWLREHQKEAGRLPAWPVSFLWGPPGTGKTTTLGALIASLLLERPSYRVLLLSTTNSAIDQSLVAVDEALEKALDAHSMMVRNSCKRIGTQFVARHYEQRNHLLPQRNPELVKQLIQHQRKRPPLGNLTAEAQWKEQDDALRQCLRAESQQIIANSRLAVMTTTRAAFDLEMLRGLRTFDLLVIDEASQVSLAHSLAIFPLAHAVIFAGDPMQLSPICQSNHPMARKWLGRSPFAIRDRIPVQEPTCFLAEQSRMAPPICEMVSRLFYGGRLEVCGRAVADPAWNQARRIAYGGAAEQHVMVIPVTEEGGFLPGLGHVREESAQRIVQIVRDLMRMGLEDGCIRVITPYRDQRNLIRSKLSQHGFSVPVTTVHRAQGSERKVIIFDPVWGAGGFLNCEEGFRLINVAFSRAQGKLIVLLSQGDSVNPKLGAIFGGPVGAPLFCQLAVHDTMSLNGRLFGYFGQLFRCTSSLDGVLRLRDSANIRRDFPLDNMLERCGDPTRCPRGCNPAQDPGSRCV